MDILDDIDKFIPTDEKARGIVIENVHTDYSPVDGDVKDVSTTISNNIASTLTTVQPILEDSWETMEHAIDEWDEFHTLVKSGMSSSEAAHQILMNSTKGLPEIKIGRPKNKKSKKKRKMSKASRRQNRNK